MLELYGLPDQALIDMGDFVGGMLKYLRRHPVPRVTVAGGMAKMTKLGQGLLDLHSRRGEVDLNWLSRIATDRAAAPSSRTGSRDPIPPWKPLVTPSAAGIDLPAGVAASALRNGRSRRLATGCGWRW